MNFLLHIYRRIFDLLNPSDGSWLVFLASLRNTVPCKQKNCRIQIDIRRCSGTNGVSNSSKFSKRNAKLDVSIILYEFATRYRFNNDFESSALCFFFEESSSWRHSKRRQRSVMLLAIRVEICQPLPDVFHSLFRALYATRMCYSCSFMFLPIFSFQLLWICCDRSWIFA